MGRSEVLKKANIATGDISVGITPPNAATATVVIKNFTGEDTIPAGCLKVFIYPMGFHKDGDQPVSALINGEEWPVGLPYEVEAKLDENSREYKRLPAYTIDGQGGRVFLHYLT
ncbi:MAG: hypothetical protein AAF705_10685 [Bacteroidota bacterium]